MAVIRIRKKAAIKRKPGDRAGMTRAKIALAAAQQIEKGGANAFSLRQLARSLGVAPTTISTHFKGGLADLEDEVLRTLLADVAPPFEPKQQPAEYLEAVFLACLKALRGRPTISMLTILRLTRNPLAVPRLAERTLACLAALGVAPEHMVSAYRAARLALFALILEGPARAYQPTNGDDPGAAKRLSTSDAGEYVYISRFRQAVLADAVDAASWAPAPEAAKAAVKELLQRLTSAGAC